MQSSRCSNTGQSPIVNRTYYPALDGLRAVAVMIVLVAHAHIRVVSSGGVGVDIFFVLSGFLITTILSAEAERRGNIDLRNFYIRRVLRLAPCLLLTTVVFAVLAYLQTQRWPWTQLAIALTHTANWARALFDVKLGAIDHYWSLAIEEQYYLVWPVIVLGLERSMRDNGRKGLLLLAATLALALYRSAMVDTFSAERIYFGLDTHMDGLVLGSALSYLIKSLRGNRDSVLNGRILGLLVVPACIAVILVLCRLTWQSPWMARLGFFAAAVAAALIIYDLMMGSASWLRVPLSLAPSVYIGRISYGIYLLHLPIFQAVDHAFPGTRLLTLFPLKIALALAAASASYYGMERHFLKLKKLFASPEPPRADSEGVRAQA
ncbi:MAG TPA: acyltransferase [Steroidobacteraceae bacterium]|jgi:peptidoglycan/LPS O-acetylase OafA/YrhL